MTLYIPVAKSRNKGNSMKYEAMGCRMRTNLGLIKIARTHKASSAQPDKSMCLNVFTVPGSQTVLSASYASWVTIQTSNRERSHTKLQVAERETKPVAPLATTAQGESNSSTCRPTDRKR